MICELILEVLPVAGNSPCYNIGEFQSFHTEGAVSFG